jgi:hypothetical protein
MSERFKPPFLGMSNRYASDRNKTIRVSFVFDFYQWPERDSHLHLSHFLAARQRVLMLQSLAIIRKFTIARDA